MVVCMVADVVNVQYHYQIVTSVDPNTVHPDQESGPSSTIANQFTVADQGYGS